MRPNGSDTGTFALGRGFRYASKGFNFSLDKHNASNS